MFKVHRKQAYFNNCFSSFWNSYVMCKKYCIFLNNCSHKNDQFLIQNSCTLKYSYEIMLVYFIIPLFSEACNLLLSCQAAVTKVMSTCPVLNHLVHSWCQFSNIYFSCLVALSTCPVPIVLVITGRYQELHSLCKLVLAKSEFFL